MYNILFRFGFLEKGFEHMLGAEDSDGSGDCDEDFWSEISDLR